MQQALASNLTITGDILKAKALNFATQLQTTTFTASDGWLSKFKKRYNIKQFIKAGEANSAPLETLEEERVALQEIIEQYDLRNVYNVDETALFWNLEPSKILSDHYISGTKKSKNRITIVLTCNADGSHKLPALVIHKWQTPRVLKGIKKDDLPIWYYWNRTAWMQVSVWRDYLNKLNQLMRR
uniref:HTH CENPB-type domain-containing protein n=1 Tax=Rhizophagus irregularis (strain DAOM 181602 / DAOM 197198 / MUCL 43194) TaxID=747089 RepID=U9TFZ1_RHIID